MPLRINSLDRDQEQHFVGPDLDTNCLQMLSASGNITTSLRADRVNLYYTHD